MKNKKRHRFTAPKPSLRKPPLQSNTSSTATAGDPRASATPKKHTGVTRYSVDFAIRICERIATTPQPVSCICQAPDMPGVATIFRWLKQHPDFREMYWEAKQMQAQLFLEEALEIVDDNSNDLIVTAEGKTLINRAALQRCKMRVEHRRWIAAKLLPRRYGSSPREDTSPPAPSSPPPPRPGKPAEDQDAILAEEFRMQLIQARRQAMATPPDDCQPDRSPDGTEPHTPNSDPQSPVPTPPPPRPNMWRDVVYPKPQKTTLQKAVSW